MKKILASTTAIVAMATFASANAANVRGIQVVKADATKDPVALIGELSTQFKDQNAEVMAKLADVAKAGDEVKADAMKAVEEAVGKVTALADNLVEVEQKIRA